MSQGERVAALSELVDGGARRVDIDGTPVCVVRVGDTVHAIGDTCSHADYSLSEGDVWADECAVECPQHGSLFSLETGEPESLPATRPVPVYKVEISGDDVYVELHP
jgi:3-phenylpropionate/trans-cinnamate dioxygenase ferredoxin subunit